MSNFKCTWISRWKFYTRLPKSFVYPGHCCISHCQIPWGCFKLRLYHLPLHVLCSEEKCVLGEQKNACMSVVGKHRHLSLKTETSVLIELRLARTASNIFVQEPFACNSDCTGQSILSEVSSVKEMKQELGTCLSIDLIILLILWQMNIASSFRLPSIFYLFMLDFIDPYLVLPDNVTWQQM